jgi:hypothetical protein
VVRLPSSTGQTASRAGAKTGTKTGSRLKGTMGSVIRTCALRGQAKELSCPVSRGDAKDLSLFPTAGAVLTV